MKIAVSAMKPGPTAAVDPHFGRCPYFAIYDSITKIWETIPNPASNASGGAGIQAAQAVVNRGVQVVITGSLGPNAYRVLEAAAIRCFTGAQGTVQEAVNAYEQGKLKELKEEPHPRPGMGMGGGWVMSMRKGGK